MVTVSGGLWLEPEVTLQRVTYRRNDGDTVAGETTSVAVRWHDRGPAHVLTPDGVVQECYREIGGDALVPQERDADAEWAWEQIRDVTMSKRARALVHEALGLGRLEEDR